MSEHARCHCGAEPVVDGFFGPAFRWFITCSAHCGIHRKPRIETVGTFDTEADAWAWWDTRPTENALRSQLAEARDYITAQVVRCDFCTNAAWYRLSIRDTGITLYDVCPEHYVMYHNAADGVEDLTTSKDAAAWLAAHDA